MRHAAWLLAAALVAHAPAQGPGKDEAKEIIQKVAKEMELIDRLLNQATQKESKSGSPGARAQGAPDEVGELLESSVKSSKTVEELIDKLLEMANQRRSQSSSGSPQDRQRDRQQGDQRDRERRPDRRMDESPDMVRRRQQQQQDQENKDDPNSPRPDRGRPEQKRGPDRQYPPGGKFDQDAEAGRWGDLPRYLQLLFRKGGEPKVPDKYKRYRDEFHKRADRKKKNK